MMQLWTGNGHSSCSEERWTWVKDVAYTGEALGIKDKGMTGRSELSEQAVSALEESQVSSVHLHIKALSTSEV